MNELEIIQHPQIRGQNLFFNTMYYRTAHFHAEWELLLPLDNPLVMTFDLERYEVLPGQIIVINSRQLHEYSTETGSCTFLCLQVSDELFPRLRGIHVEAFYPHLFMEEDEYSAFRARLLDIMHNYLVQPDFYELYCVGRTSLLLHKLLTCVPCHEMTAEEIAQREKSTARLGRLLRFVDDNFQDKILLRDFAAQEGLTINYLSGFIRQTMNQTFQEYVTTVRFHYACKRMSSTDEKLLTICMESGFSDYRYFSKAFRQRTGKTPEEYRSELHRGTPAAAKIHHSMHSLERFYTREQSLVLWETYSRIFSFSQ